MATSDKPDNRDELINQVSDTLSRNIENEKECQNIMNFYHRRLEGILIEEETIEELQGKVRQEAQRKKTAASVQPPAAGEAKSRPTVEEQSAEIKKLAAIFNSEFYSTEFDKVVSKWATKMGKEEFGKSVREKLNAAVKKEAEKMRIRETIEKEKPEASGILDTLRKMNTEQSAKILKSGRWTRTLKDGTQQALTANEKEGNFFFTDALGKRVDITDSMKFRLTERLQAGKIPEGVKQGQEFPFNFKGKWYLAKTNGKVDAQGKMEVHLKDTDGKTWMGHFPPEGIHVYRETFVDGSGTLKKAGKPDRYAWKYVPKPKQEPAAPGEKQTASPPAAVENRSDTDTLESGEVAGEGTTEGAAAPAAPSKNQPLREGIEKVLAIEGKDKQREALAELIGQEVEKRMEQRKNDGFSPAAAAAPAASGEGPTAEIPKAPSKLRQWFGKMWGELKKGFESIFKNRSRYNILQDGRLKLEEVDSTISALKGRVKLINYKTSDDRAVTGDVESYDPETRTLTLRRCRLERPDGTIEDKDIHRIRWPQAKKEAGGTISVKSKKSAAKPAVKPAAKTAGPSAPATTTTEKNQKTPPPAPENYSKFPAWARDLNLIQRGWADPQNHEQLRIKMKGIAAESNPELQKSRKELRDSLVKSKASWAPELVQQINEVDRRREEREKTREKNKPINLDDFPTHSLKDLQQFLLGKKVSGNNGKITGTCIDVIGNANNTATVKVKTDSGGEKEIRVLRTDDLKNLPKYPE